MADEDVGVESPELEPSGHPDIRYFQSTMAKRNGKSVFGGLT